MALLYWRTEKRSQYRELQSLSRQSDLLKNHMVKQAIAEAFIWGSVLGQVKIITEDM